MQHSVRPDGNLWDALREHIFSCSLINVPSVRFWWEEDEKKHQMGPEEFVVRSVEHNSSCTEDALPSDSSISNKSFPPSDVETMLQSLRSIFYVMEEKHHRSANWEWVIHLWATWGGSKGWETISHSGSVSFPEGCEASGEAAWCLAKTLETGPEAALPLWRRIMERGEFEKLKWTDVIEKNGEKT